MDVLSASDLRAGSNVVLVCAHIILVFLYGLTVVRQGVHNGWTMQCLGIVQVSGGYLVHRAWWLPFSYLVANKDADAVFFTVHSIPIIELATLLVLSGVCFHCHFVLRVLSRYVPGYARLPQGARSVIWWPLGMCIGAGIWAIGGALSLVF